MFELHGAEIAQGGMSAGPIIKSLQIRKDLRARFLPGVIQATAEGEQLAQPMLFTNCCARMLHAPLIFALFHWASRETPMYFFLERLVWRPITSFWKFMNQRLPKR
jgi:hypothetical protein